MNGRRKSWFAVSAVALTACVGYAQAAPVGTAFTYQGNLEDGGGPVTDTCDFEFELYNADVGGAQVGGTLNEVVVVDGGLFTVKLDFGAGIFKGQAARWLDVKVCCPSGGCVLDPLSARQELTPTPLALALPGLHTQENTTSSNVIGGFSGNTVDPNVVGATIGGGGDSTFPNRVAQDWGTVVGGKGNTAGGDYSFAAGRRAKARTAADVGGGDTDGDEGTFVWADSTDADFSSTGPNQFLIRAAGGVGINTNSPSAALHVGGTPGADGIKFPDNTLQTTAVPSPCGPNQVVKWDTPSSTWVCADDIDTDTDTFATLTCPTNGHVLKWNVATNGWDCRPDLRNTLDQAYDQGGPGAGRAITADAGAVLVTVPAAGVAGDAITAVHKAPSGHAGSFENQDASNSDAALDVQTVSTVSGASAIYATATGNAATHAVSGVNRSNAANAVGVEGRMTVPFFAAPPSVANFGVKGSTSATGDGAAGVKGDAYGASGTIFGVHGTTDSASADAAGVRGEANSATGKVFGIHGTAISTEADAAGVRGEASSSTGKTFGVHGTANSTEADAAGVKGVASAATGKTFGVYGRTFSSEGGAASVKGEVAGNNVPVPGHTTLIGVHGVSQVLTDSVAVQGDMLPFAVPLPPLDALIGVRGTSPGITSGGTRVGVEGDAAPGVTDPLASAGVRGWIKGSNSNPDNGVAGVVGQAEGDTGANLLPPVPFGHNGVWGITQSNKVTSSGVLGEATDPGANVYGVHGISTSTSDSACGVRGTGNGCKGAGAVNIHDGALTVSGPAKTADTVVLPPPTTPIYSCPAEVPIACSGGVNFPVPVCTDADAAGIPCDPEKDIPYIEGACKNQISGTTRHDCLIDPSQVTIKKTCTSEQHCHIIGWQFEVTVRNCLVRDDSIILLTIYEHLFNDPDHWSYTAHVIHKEDPPPPVAVGDPPGLGVFVVRYAAIGNGNVCTKPCDPPTSEIKLDYLIINPVP